MSSTARLCIVLFVIGILLALSACATEKIVYKDRYTVVEKPIAINCIKTAPVRPSYLTEWLPPSASDLEVADALGDDWATSRVYEKTMEAAVQACLMK